MREKELKGLKYKVNQLAPDYDFIKKSAVYKDSGGCLTDGKRGVLTDLNRGWVGFMRSEGVDIILDLEHPQPITLVGATFLHHPELGILMPREVVFSASFNGKEFYLLGKVKNTKPLYTKKPLIQDYFLEVEAYKARFLRINFLTDVWSFIDEITLKVTSEGAATLDVTSKPKIEKTSLSDFDKTPSPSVKDMCHMVLIYSGDTYSWQAKDFLPYVGYLNKKTLTLEDYLFDSFLFLPYGKTALGYSFNHAGEKPAQKEHWLAYLESLFVEGTNLYGLDEAVGILKASLNDPYYKAKVEIAIPYPSERQSSFGEIAGKMLDFTTINPQKALANRILAVKWYVEEAIKRFVTAKFKNLELVAFYWLEENVSFSSTPFEADLVKATAAIVHSKSLAFHWIPFVQAEGFREWSEFGFDLALMQPNYFFHPEAKEDRLINNARLAKKYGLSVEIEVSNQVFTSDYYRQRFKKYLENALEYGFNKTLLAYYQETSLFCLAALSDNPQKREIYDWVYRFISKEKI